MTTEGIEVKSVGNTLVLNESALIEAFNLKAAIEYQLKKCECKVQGEGKNTDSDWSGRLSGISGQISNHCLMHGNW